MSGLTFASFFSGIGGFELGLERAGHRRVWSCEIEPFARKVFAARFGREPEGKDINAVTPEEIPDADLWCGGFPCQDLSTAGRRRGINGARSGLVWKFLDLARERRPRWLLLENVPGLLTGRDDEDDGADVPSTGGPGVEPADESVCGSWFGALLGALDQLRYDVAWRVLDARFFGVPQRRRRVFVLAGRAGERAHPAEVLLEREGRLPRRRGSPGSDPTLGSVRLTLPAGRRALRARGGLPARPARGRARGARQGVRPRARRSPSAGPSRGIRPQARRPRLLEGVSELRSDPRARAPAPDEGATRGAAPPSPSTGPPWRGPKARAGGARGDRLSFLERTPGMTSREARDLLDLHELVQHSLVHGPVDLERYAMIRQVDSEQVASWERSARRLVQRLRALGYRVAAEGDGETLTLDFARDRFLVAEVERWVNLAQRTVSHQVEPDAAEEAPLREAGSLDAVLLDWDMGLSLDQLVERHGMRKAKVMALVRSSHRAPRPQRRPRVEERRDPELVALALAEPKGRGYLARVARALGCSRWTARRLIERMKRRTRSDLDDSREIGKIGRHTL